MLLTVDVGNTNIKLGVYKNDELVFTSRIATDRSMTEDQFALRIRDILSLRGFSPSEFRGAIVSSVVPEVNRRLRTGIELILGKKPLFLGAGIKTGLNIKIDDPSVLGADLVAGAVGAKEKYGYPCLVLDLGTATKVSAISDKGDYLGVSISPGVRLSLNALANGASQLSQISLISPDHAIGTNTVDSMRSGLVYGTADMLDGMITRMEVELGYSVKAIVATGGLCDICANCRHDILIDKGLILDGLNYIYKKNEA